ncbi:unnamed protein product [Amoebophrya sp. A25]|nr:unnamed protein product [Amoebophrya sp. A25]|eukprot:GSA25T00004124001.1
MSLKQIATSAALLGNGASAFLLTQKPSAYRASDSKAACIKYIDVLAQAHEKAARMKKGIQAFNKNQSDKSKKKEIPKSMDEMSKLADSFSQQKEFALTCKKAGKTLKAHAGMGGEDTEKYRLDLLEIVSFFANTPATKREALDKKPKNTRDANGETIATEAKLGHREFDYRKALAELVDAHSVFSNKMALRDAEMYYGIKNWSDFFIPVQQSFIAQCCGEQTVDEPAEQMNKLNTIAAERAQAEDDAAGAAKAQKEVEEPAAKKDEAAAAEKEAADKKAKEDAEKCC